MSVTLRRAVAADGPALVVAHRASRDLHHPWVDPFTDDAGFDAWRAKSLTANHAGLIADSAGAPVGILVLDNIVLGRFRNATLAWWAMTGTSGRGHMIAALRLLVAHAFDELGLHRLEANIRPENAPSIALARRAGFRCEGLSPRFLFLDGAWRDHERWVRLSDDVAAEDA